jgi:peptide/nickel transport system permease protein
MELVTPTARRDSRFDPVRSALRAMTATNEGRIGIVLVLLVLALGLVGPLAAPYDPEALGQARPALAPTATHPLGTDALGRDVLSRLLSGGRDILILPILATTLAFVTGGVAGMVFAYKGGRVDAVGSRLVDVLLGVPPLLVVMIILTGFGTSAPIVVLAIGLVFAPRVTRILRGATQAVVGQDFILAAIARGERTGSVVARELLPNIVAPGLVDFALRLTYAILFVAALSFLGLGAQPPTPDWGLMAAENRGILTVNPWASIAPALIIGMLSVGVSFIADGITQVLGLRTELLEGRA